MNTTIERQGNPSFESVLGHIKGADRTPSCAGKTQAQRWTSGELPRCLCRVKAKFLGLSERALTLGRPANTGGPAIFGG